MSDRGSWGSRLGEKAHLDPTLSTTVRVIVQMKRRLDHRLWRDIPSSSGL